MKILIVDDDESQRKILRHLIEKYYSAEVTEAKNGVEGLREMNINKPDLVVLDLMMPILNGYCTLKAMRKKETTKGIPVIILSGNQDLDIVKKVAELGVVDYFMKPLNAHQINDRLTKLVHQMSVA